MSSQTDQPTPKPLVTDAEIRAFIDAGDIQQANMTYTAEMIARELLASRSECVQLRESLARECELNWTGSLCDRLNSFAREHGRFDSQCTDGPSASRLIQDLHGYAGSLKAENARLAAELAEARKVIDGLRSDLELDTPRQVMIADIESALAARDSGKASGGGSDAR